MIKLDGEKIALYQWDLNQRLILTELDENVEVHFSRINDDMESLIKTTYIKDNVMYCDIPNILLQEKGIIYVYLFVRKEDQVYTKHEAEILVIYREKPDDYVYTDDEVYLYKQLEEMIISLGEKFEKFNGNFVKTDPANYTDEQKLQVRKNIDALGVDYKPPTPTLEQIGADPKGTANSVLNMHNVANDSHNDIRLLIEGLTKRLNNLLDTDDSSLDQLSELVAYIKNNKGLIENITTDKVSYSDVIDNLTTKVANKPLSANQGVIIKELIDGLNATVLGKPDLSESELDSLLNLISWEVPGE